MNFSEQQMINGVRESDVDLMLLLLIRTAPEFRNWLVQHAEVGLGVEEFYGVKKSVSGSQGETDLAVGLKTSDGKRRLILIEDKIDADAQERQAERYFERGEAYMERGHWDSFHVFLIAPDHYPGEYERENYEVIIDLSEIIKSLDGFDHIAKPIVTEVLQRAIEKRPSDDSVFTNKIATRFRRHQDRLPNLEINVTPQHVKVYSRDPNHPDFVCYVVYSSGTYEEEVVVRVDLDLEYPNEELNEIRADLHKLEDELDGFKTGAKIQGVILNHLCQEFDDDEEFIERIVNTFVELITTAHPRLSNNSFDVAK